MTTCPVSRGTAGGPLSAPNFASLPRHRGIWSTRPQPGPATPGPEGTEGVSRRRPVAPGAAPRARRAAGKGRRPPPRRGRDVPNGGAAAPSARARRALEAGPAALATPRAPRADPRGPLLLGSALRGDTPGGVRPSRGYITGPRPLRSRPGPAGPAPAEAGAPPLTCRRCPR